MENGLTHFDKEGNAVMVDVSGKNVTYRTALATGYIAVGPEIMACVTEGNVKKGDVLGVARVAGIMGVKKTSELIPMCHPLPIQKCAIDYELDQEKNRIHVLCTVKTEGKTGVEMEALTGVQVTLLTIYCDTSPCKLWWKFSFMYNFNACNYPGTLYSKRRRGRGI